MKVFETRECRDFFPTTTFPSIKIFFRPFFVAKLPSWGLKSVNLNSSARFVAATKNFLNFLNSHTICSQYVRPYLGRLRLDFFLLWDTRACNFTMTGSISFLPLCAREKKKHLDVAGVKHWPLGFYHKKLTSCKSIVSGLAPKWVLTYLSISCLAN